MLIIASYYYLGRQYHGYAIWVMLVLYSLIPIFQGYIIRRALEYQTVFFPKDLYRSAFTTIFLFAFLLAIEFFNEYFTSNAGWINSAIMLYILFSIIRAISDKSDKFSMILITTKSLKIYNFSYSLLLEINLEEILEAIKYDTKFLTAGLGDNLLKIKLSKIKNSEKLISCIEKYTLSQRDIPH